MRIKKILHYYYIRNILFIILEEREEAGIYERYGYKKYSSDVKHLG
jgi:hypothetical protein